MFCILWYRISQCIIVHYSYIDLNNSMGSRKLLVFLRGLAPRSEAGLRLQQKPVTPEDDAS